NSFVDGIVFRKMRENLLECFDKIYILDLHGNSKKREVAIDGSTDQNVFDIMQGVSINIFIKTGDKKKNTLGNLFHYDLYGKRNLKYDYLNSNTLKSIDWKLLNPNKPYYFFTQKEFADREKYENGFKVDSIFLQSNAGLATEFDKFVIQDSKKEAQALLNDLKTEDVQSILIKYNIDSKKVKKIKKAIADVSKNNPIITAIDYRPFDHKYTVYTGASNGVMGRPRDGIMKHLLKENIALLTCRQQTSFDFQHAFISNKISERCSVSLQTGEVNYIFPIYLYPETNGQQTIEQSEERKPNFNHEIVNKIAEQLGLTFTNEKETTENTFAPIDILDYIYAVLHSPTYREKYKEFLKIDFPRIPYPKDQETFWALVNLGGEIRQIHLLESPIVEQYITQYPIDGDNVVSKPRSVTSSAVEKHVTSSAVEKSHGKVYINDTQYFDDVPQVAWKFFIGGYQPAQKWLKDRKGRKLEFDDILHYQKIIMALSETDRLMKAIDKIEI